MKKISLVMAVVLLMLVCGCAEASDETVFEYGYLHVSLPQGMDAMSYQKGVYYNGNVSISCVGSKVGEGYIAIYDSMDAETLFEQLLDDSLFAIVYTGTNDYGVKYAVFDAIQEADDQFLKGAVLYGKGDAVIVSGNSYDSRDVSDALFYIGKNARLKEKAAVAIEPSVVKQEEGFVLLNGPITLSITEKDWNIFYAGMPEDALSLQRFGMTAGEATSRVDRAYAEIVVQSIDKLYSEKTLYVKLKDKKYAHCSTEEQNFILVTTAGQMSSSGYTVEEINGVTYYAFEAYDNEYRYSAIVNGDMLYFVLVSNEPITESDKDVLRRFVERVSYSNE